MAVAIKNAANNNFCDVFFFILWTICFDVSCQSLMFDVS